MREAGTHEKTVSGKLVTSVTTVDPVAEVNRSSFWKRAVGDCPEVTLEITGVKIKACYHTGSQCTLMTESCYRESLDDQLNLRNLDSCRWLSLSAANGMEIPRLGYLMTDVKVCEETVKDVVVIVIRDPTGSAQGNRCILGMNVISRLTQQPSVLRPTQQKISRLVRSSRVEVSVPAMTVVNLDVAVGDSSWNSEVILEPPEHPPRTGLLVLTTFTRLRKGRMTVPVVNTTEETLMLPARSTLGVVSNDAAATPTVSLKVNAVIPIPGSQMGLISTVFS